MMKNCALNSGKRALSKLQKPELLARECYVGGEWVSGDSLKDVIDPGTLLPVFETAQCGVDMVNICINHAEQARLVWQSRLPVDRGLILREWAKLARKNADDLAGFRPDPQSTTWRCPDEQFEPTVHTCGI